MYTQYKPSANSPGATEADAIALIDQWGVGRQGFDDGMAIFFNLTDECHGQVQLYAAIPAGIVGSIAAPTAYPPATILAKR